MINNEIRVDLLLSAQAALLGGVYPSIRAIEIGHEGLKKVTIIVYLDREPNDDDKENLGFYNNFISFIQKFKQLQNEK